MAAPASPHMILLSLFFRQKSHCDISETGVSMRREVSPVCLPSPTSVLPAGTPLLVAGWGAVTEGGLEADRLQEVEVEVSSHTRCRTTYQQVVGEEVGEDILCAGVEDGSKDACQGDSGGALVSEQGGVYHLVGVVFAGLGCARRNVPGLYADVARHMDWIEGVVSAGLGCARRNVPGLYADV